MNPALALAGGVACLLCLPGTCELLLLTIAAIWPKRRSVSSAVNTEWRTALIVPAHNEELGIRACVESLAASAAGNEYAEIFVVADNCSDGTRVAAELAGANVLVRDDGERRGKGHALQFAFESLLPRGYDAFLVVDADTTVSSNLLAECTRCLQAGADAIQCRYLVSNADECVRTRLMKIALLAFNVLRPRGRERLGLSCGIYGNGFGMRRETLLRVPYGAVSMVEDAEYHLRLIEADLSVRFVESAAVYADVPVHGKGVTSQRTRWEGGRLRLCFEQAPKLMAQILKGRMQAVEPLLDLLLLPLAFHVALLVAATILSSGPVRLASMFGLFAVAVHILTAIASDGDWQDVAALGAAPFYVLWKLALVPRLLKSAAGRQAWVRTERASERSRT